MSGNRRTAYVPIVVMVLLVEQGHGGLLGDLY